MVRCFLSALTGAVVVFIWSSFSWMVLPWHSWEIKSFSQNGTLVAQAIMQEATEPGIYLVPNMQADLAQDLDKQKDWQAKARKGPFVYMSVNPNGTPWDMNASMLIQFLIEFVIAAVATSLLARVNLRNVFSQALFVSVTVSLGAFLMSASAWNWWGFPLRTVWINVPDVAIGWFLAGLAIAAITKNKTDRTFAVLP